MLFASGAELLVFARLLLVVPADQQIGFADRLLAEVEAAGDHLRTFGRCHPCFGDGTLMSRCLSLSPPKESNALDEAFLAAMITTCKTLLDHSKS